MPHAAQLPAGAPAILGEVRPASLPRAQLVGHGRGFSWITEKICGIAEEKTPPWWWWCFGVACVIASFTVAGLTYLVSTGVGVWGHRSPVNWAWDIVNFVFWIGIGHAGTLISAILCLLRQKWRTSINRSAEAMTIFAVVCAAIFPVFHLGRIWYSWFLFPLPNSNIVWQNYRSPLEWDVFAVSTYGTVSVLFWYVGMIPDLATFRDRFAAAGRNMRAKIYGVFAMGWRRNARRPHRCLVLPPHRLGCAPALLNVALQPPFEAKLIRRIDIDAQIVERQQIRVVESKKPLHNQKRSCRDSLRAPQHAGVCREVVDWPLNSFAPCQSRHVCSKQCALNHRRIVEVLQDALAVRHVAQVAVVVVEMEVNPTQRVRQFSRQGSFTRTRATGNAQHHGRKRQSRRLRSCFVSGLVVPLAHSSASNTAAILGASFSSSPASRRST